MSASLLEAVLRNQEVDAERIGDTAQIDAWRDRLATHIPPQRH